MIGAAAGLTAHPSPYHLQRLSPLRSGSSADLQMFSDTPETRPGASGTSAAVELVGLSFFGLRQIQQHVGV